MRQGAGGLADEGPDQSVPRVYQDCDKLLLARQDCDKLLLAREHCDKLLLARQDCDRRCLFAAITAARGD